MRPKLPVSLSSNADTRLSPHRRAKSRHDTKRAQELHENVIAKDSAYRTAHLFLEITMMAQHRLPAALSSFYSLHRRNSSAPFVPPNPNEFDMAYSNDAFRAWLGTKSILSVSGSWFSRLMVGGSI